MALALNNLKRVDMPLKKETKQTISGDQNCICDACTLSYAAGVCIAEQVMLKLTFNAIESGPRHVCVTLPTREREKEFFSVQEDLIRGDITYDGLFEGW